MKLGERGGRPLWRRHQPWQTWVFTAVLALLVIPGWSAVARLRPPHTTLQIPWLLLAVGFACGRIVALRFEFSGESHVVTLSEVPLLIGLVFTRSEGLLLAAVVGSALGALWRREAPVKAAFNIVTRALETVVAALCFHAVLGHAGALSSRGWLAAFVAVPAADVVSAVCVRVVIALSTGRFNRSGLRSVAMVLAGVAALNIAVGQVAVAVLSVNWLYAVSFLAITVVLVVGYRAHSGLRRRHHDLEQVYQFGQAVAGPVEAEAVIRSVLSEARALLRGGVAELSLRQAGAGIRYSLRGDAMEVSRAETGHPLEGLVGAGPRGVLAPVGTSHAGLARALARGGYRDAVAAPVHGDDGTSGLLVVADRMSDRLTFEIADLKLLEALASHASMALRSGQLLDRLRLEVTIKNHQAVHDALTGLGNRTLFTNEVDAALARRGGESVVAVMLMDLDRFKEVNDTLGHHTGDLMLQQIATQLQEAVGGRGSVARLGGDEFAFVVHAATRSDVAAIAQEVLSAGQATVLVEGLRLEVRASLGVALDPDHGTDRSTLLRRADIAMYHAKTNGSGIEVYQPEHDPHSTRRLVLASELRLALETSSLELHYQPKAEIASGRVSGVEALLRWTHPVYGSIPPGEFIPLAEQSGLIRPLTLWALEAGLTQLASWRREGLDLTLAVNLSARSVFDAELTDDLNRLLTETNVAPDALILEITESSIFGDRPQGHDVVDDLARLGVRIAIDDFGTGYSSLSRLERLPVHEVKIDKSFVTGMLADDGHEAIVRSTIDLARNLKLRVVAEGVEDRRTWQRLGQLGCDGAQGYYLSRPLRAGELAEWVWHYQREDAAVIRPLRSVSR